MSAMSADQFIAARVSSETKDRLKSLAAKRQLSESALLKDLLELTESDSNAWRWRTARDRGQRLWL